MTSFAPTVNQAVAIEHRVDGADRRGLDIAMQPPELFADLRCAPTRAFPLELNDRLLDLGWQPVGVSVGPSTTIGESVEATVLVALVDLVAGLARDIELAA